MTPLIGVGCSFIFGSELSDCDPIRGSLLTWPALICKKLNLCYECIGLGGRGNLAIAESVLHLLETDDEPDEIFVINWTFIDRFDYQDPQTQQRGPMCWDTVRPSDPNRNSRWYFREMHSQYRDKLTSLLYVSSVVDQLIRRNRKFIMTSIDDNLLCDRYHAPSHISTIQTRIRPYFYDFEGKNFLDWSRDKNFAIGKNGHPLEQAHESAAQLLMPVIDNILHRN